MLPNIQANKEYGQLFVEPVFGMVVNGVWEACFYILGNRNKEKKLGIGLFYKILGGELLNKLESKLSTYSFLGTYHSWGHFQEGARMLV